MRLKNKVALITGGGRGIGAATALLFASEGAKVAIASRTEKEIFDVAGQIKIKYGPDVVLAHPADVSDESSVRDLFSKVLERFGPMDILVNNAATLEVKDFVDLTTEMWDEMMAVNLRGAFLCSREAFRQMKDSGRGGVIVNLSSLGGIQSTPKFKGLSAYTVSKYGIVGLTECLAVEGKPFGIRVNCVAPGAVDTDMLKKAAPFLKTRTTPEDVARTILFLCDEKESRSLNGTVIEIHSNE
jgi:NAD(P)-dependent dehydrogenase (short-subunit alcohol dehydrogenase family)